MSQAPPQQQPQYPQYPGQYPPGPMVVVNRKTNPYAVASLVCSILWMFWLGSILGLAFAAVASKQIRESGNTETGQGFAVVGGVIAALSFLPVIAVIAAAAGS